MKKNEYFEKQERVSIKQSTQNEGNNNIKKKLAKENKLRTNRRKKKLTLKRAATSTAIIVDDLNVDLVPDLVMQIPKIAQELQIHNQIRPDHTIRILNVDEKIKQLATTLKKLRYIIGKYEDDSVVERLIETPNFVRLITHFTGQALYPDIVCNAMWLIVNMTSYELDARVTEAFIECGILHPMHQILNQRGVGKTQLMIQFHTIWAIGNICGEEKLTFRERIIEELFHEKIITLIRFLEKLRYEHQLGESTETQIEDLTNISFWTFSIMYRPRKGFLQDIPLKYILTVIPLLREYMLHSENPSILFNVFWTIDYMIRHKNNDVLSAILYNQIKEKHVREMRTIFREESQNNLYFGSASPTAEDPTPVLKRLFSLYELSSSQEKLKQGVFNMLLNFVAGDTKQTKDVASFDNFKLIRIIRSKLCEHVQLRGCFYGCMNLSAEYEFVQELINENIYHLIASKIMNHIGGKFRLQTEVIEYGLNSICYAIINAKENLISTLVEHHRVLEVFNFCIMDTTKDLTTLILHCLTRILALGSRIADEIGSTNNVFHEHLDELDFFDKIELLTQHRIPEIRDNASYLLKMYCHMDSDEEDSIIHYTPYNSHVTFQGLSGDPQTPPPSSSTVDDHPYMMD
mmetsp:Transcript_6993/g.10257  ORF Transcript_6993/g.10257 Transcript_6993/m.10257 type:complete len:632 (+) Transcript_6993:93-1988(+)